MKFSGIYGIKSDSRIINKVFSRLPAFFNIVIWICFIVTNLREWPLTNIWHASLFIGLISVLIMGVYQRMKWKKVECFMDDIKTIDLKVKFVTFFFSL